MPKSSDYVVTISAPGATKRCGGCGCGEVHKFHELQDIEDCCLTPGDPSPAGRCPNCGDLVYPLPART